MIQPLTWREIKVKVEAAGVKDDDRVEPRPYYGPEDWVVERTDAAYKADIGADYSLLVCI